MTLDECHAHVGAGVVYSPEGGLREDGVITSVGSAYVFVQYSGDRQSKATHPSQLALLVRSE